LDTLNTKTMLTESGIVSQWKLRKPDKGYEKNLMRLCQERYEEFRPVCEDAPDKGTSNWKSRGYLANWCLWSYD